MREAMAAVVKPLSDRIQELEKRDRAAVREDTTGKRVAAGERCG